MSRIVQILVDDKFNTSMKKLNEEIRRRGEEIVSTEKVTQPDGTSVMVVSLNTVKKTESKKTGSNLLLDSTPQRGGKVLLD